MKNELVDVIIEFQFNSLEKMDMCIELVEHRWK